MSKIYQYMTALLVLVSGVVFISCDEDEGDFPRTRLFQPVLNDVLTAEGNTIIVNIAKAREAISYTMEVSRDTFKTIDYRIESDTNYIVINEELAGEELLWYTLYQIRAKAHADEDEYDSKMSELGNIRTQRFPSNLNVPASNDVIDVAAKVTWERTGLPVTQVRVFASDDSRLEHPLAVIAVSAEEEEAGTKIVTGLTPKTEYQIAIYSSDEIRGWANYTTLASVADKSDPNVIDLSDSEDPNAVINAVASAANGNIIIVKKGVQYDLPLDGIDKSITIQGDLGFGSRQATLYSAGNWNIADGASVGYVRFVDLELIGESFGDHYVFNIDKSGTLGELTFDGCYIHHLRGVLRVKGGSGTIENYNIVNCVADSINGYAAMNVDINTWKVNNINFQNSTFSRFQYFLVSKNNSNTLLINGCTINEAPGSGLQLLRWREEGQNNITGGVTITNSIIGHGWDMSGGENYMISGIEGLAETSFTVVNTWTTSDFASSTEIPGLGSQTYSGTVDALWVDPENGDYNFKDTGFAGRTDSGDPRWRTEF